MEANTESNHNKQSIIITVCSTKGGVGKTTLAANLGGLLAGLNPNHKVLLIDGDLQPTLQEFLGHTDFKTTLLYVENDVDKIRDSLEKLTPIIT